MQFIDIRFGNIAVTVIVTGIIIIIINIIIIIIIIIIVIIVIIIGIQGMVTLVLIKISNTDPFLLFFSLY